MEPSEQVFGRLRGFVEQAAARVAACLPASASPEAIKGVVQQGVVEGWQRSEKQRRKWGQRLQWGSAKLASAPLPKAARVSLKRFDALLQCVTPDSDAAETQTQTHHAQARERAETQAQSARETLVSPLDLASLDNDPSADNCLAAGTNPEAAAVVKERAASRRPEGRARRSRGGRRSGPPKD